MRGSSRGGAVIVALGSVMLLGGACSTDESPSGEFTVLTYNVAGLPQELSDVNPEEHIPLISPLLNDYEIVLTQEDFDYWRPLLDSLDFVHYHERLRGEATHEYATARYPGPEASGIDPATRPALQVGDGLGVLSRFPLGDEVRVPWTGCFGGFDVNDQGAADCLAAKGFARVQLTLSDDDGGPFEVDVYTLHAEAGATAEDQRLQEADFVQLADYMDEHSAGRAVILGGDTNLHTHSQHPDGQDGADTRIWEEFLEQTDLTDACAELRCPETDAIDKVAYRSGGRTTLTATSHDFPRDRFRDPDGEELSDHPPLAVGFRWEATTDS